jgi:hypothetical protein
VTSAAARGSSPAAGTVELMALGKGKTEHAGPRDMSRKHGHWGFTEEAKEWAGRARRRDEDDELRRELADAEADRRVAEDPTAPA